MRILITGANGQVGRALQKAASAHALPATGCTHPDITDALAVRAAIGNFRPDAVINAAAYRQVDKAESEAERAFAVNRDGPAILAACCHEAGIPLIHLSTDCVFDGRKAEAYVEDDACVPLGVYGASKLAGENAVRSICPRHLILRTSWVFSEHRVNFVKTVLHMGAEQDELRIVADQHGCPTSAHELARGIMHMLQSGIQAWGSYHFCQPEATTWHGFATAIVAEAGKQHWPLKAQHVVAIQTGDYPTPARRPANCVLNCSKLESVFGYTIPPWRESLNAVIRELHTQHQGS